MREPALRPNTTFRSRFVPSLAGAGFLFCMGAVDSAWAQETEPKPYAPCTVAPDEAATQAAQGAFQAGSASFNEADYPRAIFYWEDAYRRDCTAHAMLKNLARAYELDEQYMHAFLALQTYLERHPDSGEDEAIQRRISNLERKLEERRAAAAAPPPKETAPRVVPPVRQEPEPVPDEPVYDEPSSSGRSAVPLVVAGVGAAVGITGGALWLVAKQDEKDAEKQCGPGGRANCLDSAVEAGNDAIDRQVLWSIVGGVGGAIAVTGVIWYFAQSDGSEAQARTHFAPELGAGYAGFRVNGRF